MTSTRSIGPARLVGLVLVLALAATACRSGGTADPTASPTLTPSPTLSETPTPSPTLTPTPRATETEDDGLVLAGQFTAFVGADGSGPACQAFWWAEALGGQPYVGLSDSREVTAAGRLEPLCLLGFDGAVELTVTGPDGDEQVIPLDATLDDGGVGVLPVDATASTPVVVMAAWQPSPGPSGTPGDPATAPETEAPSTADETEAPTDGPATPDDTEQPTEDETFDEQPDPVNLTWNVPSEARGDYRFVARQDDREASATITVLAPTRLEIGAEDDGTRRITLHDGPDGPVPLGVYQVVDEFGDLVAIDDYRGRTFELVADVGPIGNDSPVDVATDDLEPGRYCAISPAVEFVDCRPNEVEGAGWLE